MRTHHAQLASKLCPHLSTSFLGVGSRGEDPPPVIRQYSGERYVA
jgi:hypothetical protein